MGRPVPIRPSTPDHTQVRISGPSATPDESYWRALERDATKYAARTLHVDEPSLAGLVSEDEAARLRRGFSCLREVLPNTRLILTAAPGAFSREAMPMAVRLPVDALYLDLVRRPHLLVEALALAPTGLELVVGEARS
jgi:hypothetical protein